MKEKNYDLIENLICSTLSVVELDKIKNEAVQFRSGFVGKFDNEHYFITAIHHFDKNNSSLNIENAVFTNQFNYPIIRIDYYNSWGSFYLNEDEISQLDDNLFQNKIKNSEEVDLLYGKIDIQNDLIQYKMEIGEHTVSKQSKRIIDLNNLADYSIAKYYGFFGYGKHKIVGVRILREGFAVYPIIINNENGDYIYFQTLLEEAKTGDYEGLSGAPILDQDGKFIAILVKFFPKTNIIIGFKASIVVEFIKATIKIEQDLIPARTAR